MNLKGNIVHGMYGHPAHTSWRAMKARCDNPKNKNYNLYGGRGIKYDPKWKLFENFWTDMGPSFVDGMTLDRKDGNKGYNKENCRWITQKEQNRNRRDNRIVQTAKGPMRLPIALDVYQIPSYTYYRLMYEGYPDTYLFS